MYKDFIDVKGPLFYEIAAISQIIQYSSISLFLVEFLFLFTSSLVIYKFIKSFGATKKLSLLSSLITINVLFTKALEGQGKLLPETTVTLLSFFIFLYIFKNIHEQKLKLRYFIIIGIVISSIFWSKALNLLPLISFVLLYVIIMLFKDRSFLLNILKKSIWFLCSFVVTSFIIVLPMIIQRTFFNMIDNCFILPAKRSHFGIQYIPTSFIKHFSSSPNLLIVVIGVIFFIMISCFDLKIKVFLCCSYILTLALMLSSLEGEAYSNMSEYIILYYFIVFIPISIFSYKNILKREYISLFNLQLFILLILLFSIQVTSILTVHWKSSLANIKFHYKGKPNIVKKLETDQTISYNVYSTSYYPYKNLCNNNYYSWRYNPIDTITNKQTRVFRDYSNYLNNCKSVFSIETRASIAKPLIFNSSTIKNNYPENIFIYRDKIYYEKYNKIFTLISSYPKNCVKNQNNKIELSKCISKMRDKSIQKYSILKNHKYRVNSLYIYKDLFYFVWEKQENI